MMWKGLVINHNEYFFFKHSNILSILLTRMYEFYNYKKKYDMIVKSC